MDDRLCRGEAAKHPESANLAALLRNVSECGPEFGKE